MIKKISKKRGTSSVNTKTLTILQTLSKIGKILSTIVFVFCIVGGALCIAGILGLAIIPEGVKIGGVTIRGLIENNSGYSIGTIYALMSSGIIFCAGEAVLAKFAQRYFENELKAGTPFTFDGAKELIRLGVLAICIPAGTAILASIVYGVFKLLAKDVAAFDLHDSVSIGMGLMMIIGGLLCRHGAEVSAHTEEPKAE